MARQKNENGVVRDLTLEEENEYLQMYKNILQDGDTIIVAKTLKVKGMSKTCFVKKS